MPFKFWYKLLLTTSFCVSCYCLLSTDEEGASQVVVQCMQYRRRGFNTCIGKILLEGDMATHCCILTWKIPWTEESDGLQSMGSKRVRHNWTHMCTCACTHAHTHVHSQMRKLKPRGNLPKVTGWVGGGRFDSRQSGSIVYVLNWLSNVLRTKGLFFFFLNVDHCCCSVTQSCPNLCDPMDCSMAGFLVLRHPPEFAQTHVHWVRDSIQ